ncbi:hypothetical protein ACROYT_G009031 [Oculina patagonica]
MACPAGAVGGGVAVAMNDSSEEDEVVDNIKYTICGILASPLFDKKAIQQRSLKLSEAYCLLWQNSKTGDVDGRQGSKAKIGGAVCAVLLDLIAMGKIWIEFEKKKFLFVNYTDIWVRVNDPSPTGTFLDRALFNKIAAKSKEGYKRKLVDWIRDCITDWGCDNNVPSVCLDSLVKQGILGKERKMAGLTTDYPTKNPEPRKSLSCEIRKIALEETKPDCYMRTLLTVLRAVDNFYSFDDPFLERHFTSKEYKGAKATIKKVVMFNNV